MAELDIVIKTLLEADQQASAAKIRGQIPGIAAALKGTPVKVPIEIDTDKLNASAAKTKRTFGDALKSVGATGKVDLSRSVEVKGAVSQIEALLKLVEQYKKTIVGTQGKLASTSISQDTGTGNYKALLTYQNGVGKTTQYMMQLDAATQKATVDQVKLTDQIAKAEAQKQKSIESTKNFLSQQESALKNLESKAFNQKNPLDDAHSETFKNAANAYREAINRAGDSVTSEYKRHLSELREATKIALSEAKSAQYGATENRSKDVSQEKVVQGNKLKTLATDAQLSGQYVGTLKASIDALVGSLARVSDAPGLEKWQGEFKAVQSEVEAFKRSIAGLAQAQAGKIDAGALAQIQNIMSNPAFQNADTSGITKLRTELTQLGAEYARIAAEMRRPDITGEQFSLLNQQLSEIEPKFKSAMNAAKAFDGTFKSAQGLAKMQSQIDAARSSLDALEGNWSAFKRNPALVAEFSQLKLAAQDLDAVNFGNFQKQLGAFRSHVRAAGLDMRSFGDEMKNSFAKFSTWFGIAGVTTGIIRGFKDVVQSVQAVNAEMVELKKVTDESESTYKSYLANAGKRSQQIGTELDDYIASTSTFSRLGFGFEDSQGLAEVANIYYRVGDEIANIDEATKSVISTMQAFGVEASDAVSIVDKLNSAGNSMSISSGGVGAALQRSASALAEANNDLDESIALIAAANRVAQDPESVGKPLCPAA